MFIGIAQEKATSFKARKVTQAGYVSFDFSRQSVAVNHIYFYVQDLEWGPAFVKVGTYLPYPVRVCLNGHHWVQQQLRRAGIPFDALDNGFRWCAEPARLQAVCDALGPADVQAFFDRWVDRLPWPLVPADRDAGYRHRLSLWQVEVSLTHIFRQPVYGRRVFEAMIRENLDLGRPDRVSLVFPTRLTRATPPPRRGYHTRVLTAGVAPSVHVAFKHTDLKQYWKGGCGLSTTDQPSRVALFSHGYRVESKSVSTDKPLMPMTPVKGMRIWWLIVARKPLLARECRMLHSLPESVPCRKTPAAHASHNFDRDRGDASALALHWA